jgi:hypothetical protein
MIVFGAGASSCAAKYKNLVFSRNIEVTITTVPAGTTTGAADLQGRIWVCCYAIFSLPHSNQVPSVQMQCRMTTIASDRYLGLFGANTLHQPNTHTFKADQR